MDKRKLAEKFRALRKASGLRQEDLAANSGVSIGVIKEIEAANGNPTIDTLDAILSALNSSLPKFFASFESDIYQPASAVLEVHDLIRDMSQSELNTLKFTAKGLVAKRPNQSKDSKEG